MTPKYTQDETDKLLDAVLTSPLKPFVTRDVDVPEQPRRTLVSDAQIDSEDIRLLNVFREDGDLTLWLRYLQDLHRVAVGATVSDSGVRFYTRYADDPAQSSTGGDYDYFVDIFQIPNRVCVRFGWSCIAEYRDWNSEDDIQVFLWNERLQNAYMDLAREYAGFVGL